MSGVGKSTLVNTLLGRQAQQIGEVRASDARGRHTTTHRELFVMESGALLIDTPGMRELGLWEIDEVTSFDDVDALIAACRFQRLPARDRARVCDPRGAGQRRAVRRALGQLRTAATAAGRAGGGGTRRLPAARARAARPPALIA
jgi:ribosome biogenesis GTPase